MAYEGGAKVRKKMGHPLPGFIHSRTWHALVSATQSLHENAHRLSSCWLICFSMRHEHMETMQSIYNPAFPVLRMGNPVGTPGRVGHAIGGAPGGAA